ncbi:vacuolar protein sorting-associated protein 8 homolog [Myxocyprinus asiaticus]|uniref:vacuolar protein sorting-associated protein 8 homolog n=1 Tax=Myxocyprinus asiaticus TaxID=70543 RepID=UPI002221A3A0|nr:vacuolar protein sorting-associated protein 8 homolog [Myxocyprinus asiaticus]
MLNISLSLQEELFIYIHNILSMPGYSPEEKQSVWVKALQHIKDLVSINLFKTTELVVMHFAGEVQSIITALQTLKGKLHKLALEGSEDDRPNADEACDKVQSLLQRVEEALHDIIALCQRNSHGLNQQQREALWFPLLEAMMSPQKLLKGPDARHTSDALKELTMKVLNSMSSLITPPAIIQRILQDPVYGKGKLVEIQGLILGMLETFNYEQTLLETTTNLLNSDLHWSLSHLRKAVSRGLHPRQDHCNICLQQYKRRQETVVTCTTASVYSIKRWEF